MKETNINEILENIKSKKILGENIENVFEEFYNKYYKLVFKISFSVLKNYENSEDVTQEVFAKIYKLSSDKFPTKKEVSWLYTVTKNESITYLRKIKNAENIDDMYKISDDNEDIEEIISKDKYNRIIENLPEIEKEIVSLKILGGLSFKEISKLLSIPIGTIQWHYYKAVDKLKILISNITICIIAIGVGLNLFEKNKKSLDKIPQQEENIKEDYDQEYSKTEDKNNYNQDQETATLSKENNTDSIFSYETEKENYINEISVETDIIKKENYNAKIGIASISLIILVILGLIFIKIKKYKKTIDK